MNKIKLLCKHIDVAPLLWAIQANPHLWNEHTDRTESPDSPHYGLSDIWVRYAQGGHTSNDPHQAIWYEQCNVLPVRELVYPLMQMVEGDILGGILITKIPAGKSCKPHVDPGWHARVYKKFAIQVQSAPGQVFHFEDQKLESRPGDVYFFDNAYEHWVTNDTDVDRITLIVCIKTDKEF